MLRRRIGIAVTVGVALAAIGAADASAATFTVINNSDSGANSLRDAITQAEANNNQPTVDLINFNAVLTGGQTIQLVTVLPGIEEPVTINGCSASVNNAGPCVGVRGVDTNTDALGPIGGPNVTIRGLAFTNVDRAIPGLSGSTSLTVKNNWFGIKLDGTTNEANQIGVEVTDDNAVIGGTGGASGTSPADRNVFANSTDEGLSIFTSDNAVVQGNYFGTNVAGGAAAANAQDIVLDDNGFDTPDGTTIGGPDTGTPTVCDGPCNVISGATSTGINLDASGGSVAGDGSTIKGNFIGYNAAGTAAIGNNNGIRTLDAPNITIGGPAAVDRNYMTGGSNPISSNFSGAPDLLIENNFIGTNIAGTAVLSPPSSMGINVRSKNAANPATVTGNRIATGAPASDFIGINGTGGILSDNLIGVGPSGENLGAGSNAIRAVGTNGWTISGNTLGNYGLIGISLEGSDNSTITGNFIGTDAANHNEGSGTDRGILITSFFANASSGNTIGGDVASEENVISNIGNDAIEIVNDSDNPPDPPSGSLVHNDDNTIMRNRGSNNGSAATDLFIDLRDNYPPASGNGPGNPATTGPNHGIGAPVITSATDDMVAGSGAAPNATVLVFRTPDSGNPTDISSFVGQATASAVGAWQLPVNIPNATRVTALQTDASGDSSELSASKAAVADPPETTITGGPRKRSRLKGHSKRKKVTFTFTSSEPGKGGFQCQIDVKPFVLCSSPFVRKLKRGKHTFRVRAYDAASNPDPTLAIRSFRIVRRRHH
jgi:parallel beta-helix repeat protein